VIEKGWWREKGVFDESFDMDLSICVHDGIARQWLCGYTGK
jgi:hypothetical protein